MSNARAVGGDAATVLVVDDADAVRELVRLALERTGRSIVVAASGAEAVAAAAGLAIDLLITDVLLPDVSGPELAAVLRADHPSLRVIYISGWYDHADFPGVRDGPLLTKPFSIDDLRRAVAGAFDDTGEGPA
jgi:two-component system cell cycle sensor histidine kinase/response regulator CckA